MKLSGVINLWKGENGHAFLTFSNSLYMSSCMYDKYNYNIKVGNWYNSLSE